MRRAALAALAMALLASVGCGGRHYVIERDAGRVDSKRSVTSASDTEWGVEREPDPAER